MKTLSAFILFLILCLPIGDSSAQAPQGLPTQPAAIDTALVEIVLPEDSPSCLSFFISPDTLGFGIARTLLLDFAEGAPAPLLADLEVTEPWLQLSPVEEESPPQQLILNIHAYRLNPFRIKVSGVESPVLLVQGTTSDTSETAPVRMPGLWGLRWWLLVLPSLLMALLVMGLWWLWQRRLRLEPLQQWAPAAPAWLHASIDLRNLLQTGFPDLHTSRVFLDQLSTICRGFIARRYLVHASEMTSTEILTSCRLKGHDNRSLRRMIGILQELDYNRYNPEAPATSWCRNQANEFLSFMDEVRILPRYTHVEAELLVEAEKAWAWLNQDENRLPHESAAEGEQP